MSDQHERAGTRQIDVETRTTVDPLAVWRAWADPDAISRWFTDAAEGEPIVGSTFTWVFERFGYRLPYRVLHAIPGERWTLGWEIPGRPAGVLDVTIRREGSETVVRLVNSGFLAGAEWDEEYEGIDSGWRLSLAMLKHHLEHYPARQKRTAFVVRPASFSYDRLRPLYRDDGPARWLATSGAVGAAGDACALAVIDARALTGRVLAVTSTEVAISWPEEGGVLELKAFATGPGKRALAIRVTSWTAGPEWVEATERWATAALDRLVDELERVPASA